LEEISTPDWQSQQQTSLLHSQRAAAWARIQRISDNKKAECMSKMTIQASNFEKIPENQGVTCNNSTAASTNAEDFCPSERLKPVRKAVCHFSKKTSENDQMKRSNTAWTQLSLESNQCHSLLWTKCHGHDCGRDRGEKGITIGGCG